MKRSQLVTAIALSLGVTGWFSPGLASFARAADCDRPRSSSYGSADADRGLLDTFDDLACKYLDNRPQRPSILSTLKSNLTRSRSNQKCDQPTCGVEPACGTEVSCGVEPGCGVEPVCGVEPGCGVAERGFGYVPRDITMNHHVSPIDAANQSPPGIYYRPQVQQVPPTHPMPPHMQQMPRQMYQTPVLPAPQAHPAPQAQSIPRLQPAPQVQPAPQAQPSPQAQPVVPGFEAIPVPQVQDSVTDPFRDDAAIQFRPRRLPAHPATHRLPTSHGSPAARRPVLHYDPQARSAPVGLPTGSVPARGHISSDPEPAAESMAQAQPVSSRLGAETRGVSSSRTSSVDQSPSSQRSSRGSAAVVPASATEPARLPPLKSAVEPQGGQEAEDLPTVRNPLRG